MKINGKDNTPGLSQLGNVGGQTRAKASEATGQAGGESAVAKLSGKFSELKAGDAPFDASKVEQIRQAISEGKFEVNPEAVAKAIIASAKELTGQV